MSEPEPTLKYSALKSDALAVPLTPGNTTPSLAKRKAAGKLIFTHVIITAVVGRCRAAPCVREHRSRSNLVCGDGRGMHGRLPGGRTLMRPKEHSVEGQVRREESPLGRQHAGRS